MNRRDLESLLEQIPEPRREAVRRFLAYFLESIEPGGDVLARAWLDDLENDIPLRLDQHGVIRVGGTRVTLQTIVTAFRLGATPEEIAQQYPSVSLPDIYWVISYYLRHKDIVEPYLQEQQQRAEQLRAEIEKEFPPDGILQRLLARAKRAS
ncbi:MAG: DUF433 domain-containing protein [Armatimonadetes bacterium]|nr:DUF433 domain-containing protein [Armatimonadota bacterium]